MPVVGIVIDSASSTVNVAALLLIVGVTAVGALLSVRTKTCVCGVSTPLFAVMVNVAARARQRHTAERARAISVICENNPRRNCAAFA